MKVIVTGCGGFLGSEIVRRLIDRGDQVIGIARGDYPDLVDRGMRLVRGDIGDPSFVRQSIRDADAVVHTAAKAGVWGPAETYQRINADATLWLTEACRQAAIKTLVYTSSPSVTFDGGHQRGVDESVGYPDRYLCHYPRTKMLGEVGVLRADRPGGLRTCSLRPHLIWGDGDPHLLPRILQRARSGQLRIVGDGQNIVDMVHVRNAAAAHLAAIDRLGATPDAVGGRAFFITDDRPVRCWDWIADVCQMHDVEPPRRRIAYHVAYGIGGVLETAFRVLGRRDEPRMTRFVAAQLARDHFFDIKAAKERLGYRPAVSAEEGLAEMSHRFAQSRGKG